MEPIPLHQRRMGPERQEEPSHDSTKKELQIIGDRNSSLGYETREFLYRSGVKFEWVQEDGAPQINCIFPDNTTLRSPRIHEIAERLGFIKKPRYSEYDVVIFGAGPAGLSAGVYAASEGLKTAIVEKGAVGGQATTSSLIENYLGFPEGVSGAELADRSRRQATKMGADILLVCEGIGAYIRDGLIHLKLQDGSELRSRTAVCGTGVNYRKLDLPNEDQFYGCGLFYGAGAGEAMYCEGDDVYVVGGGNSAGQAAVYFAKGAKMVTMVVRGPNLSSTLSNYLILKINNTPNIRVWLNSKVVGLSGDKTLKTITVEDNTTQKRTQFYCEHLFVCVGGTPNNSWSRDTRLIRDKAGYFVTGSNLLDYKDQITTWSLKRDPYYLETNVAGVFAIGDVRHESVKRIASAVGEGAVVSSFLLRYLAEAEVSGYGRPDSKAD